ncbi:hypothetical protein BD309DRAFT_966922 [Dichomitus squalens]|uniref:Uncharacterized protein n=1 Tax=Dichomitus squalens TaxID=114155 RepID=A0A4Q9M8D5_9APHY|nr:hypothetical protein BD311DRAFT_771324 [Dichomitus squalens]TBU40691.1 hypothetical protein BD309DRAFT_966922 [Dichomitus squalens]
MVGWMSLTAHSNRRDLSCLILLVVFPKALPARISPHRESLGGASSDSFCSSEPFLALRARPLPAASETPPTRRIYYCSSAYSPANRYASGRRVRAFP